ncbi:ATP-dependent helicase, partial [Candidatus Woesearchaeota archaeon]|nr:ATP-dependent helicase [Candidatus Woesearchaeota archaeon]
MSEDQLLAESEDEDLVLLYTTYQDILNSQNAIDFDDLILLTYNLFIQNPKIAALYRRTYQYICIDEAQDLNYAQYQLLRSITIGEHRNVMMVGDPNQSIFAFNGSSSEYMTEMFVEDFQPKIIELKENYRSSISVLQAAERIIPDACNIVNTVRKGIFEIHEMDNEECEAKWIVGKIAELIKLAKHDDIEGNITYEKIAILGRNKYVFKPLTDFFVKKGLSYYYKITPGAVQFESKLMKIFDMALRVKLNPEDTLHWYRLLELSNNAEAKNLKELSMCVDKEAYKEVLNTVIDFSNDGSNLILLLNNFSKSIRENSYIENYNEEMMILNDIEELLGHWYEYAIRTDKKSLQQFKNSMALGKTHPLAQKNGITLSTVHTMKGQEYDIVFLMGMDDETFPDYRAIKSRGI